VDASSWESTEASMSLQNLKCIKGGLIPGTYYTFRVRANSATSDGVWGRPSEPVATLNADGTEVQGAPPQMPPCEVAENEPSAEVNGQYSKSVSELRLRFGLTQSMPSQGPSAQATSSLQQAEELSSAESPHSREPSNRGLSALVEPRKSRPGAAAPKISSGTGGADLDSARDSECGILIERDSNDAASDAAIRGGPARGSTATTPANGGAGQSVTKPGGRTSARSPRVRWLDSARGSGVLVEWDAIDIGTSHSTEEVSYEVQWRRAPTATAQAIAPASAAACTAEDEGAGEGQWATTAVASQVRGLRCVKSGLAPGAEYVFRVAPSAALRSRLGAPFSPPSSPVRIPPPTSQQSHGQPADDGGLHGEGSSRRRDSSMLELQRTNTELV